jgi:hypothetical protein
LPVTVTAPYIATGYASTAHRQSRRFSNGHDASAAKSANAMCKLGIAA